MSVNTNGTDSLPHVLWFQLAPILNDNRCGASKNACPQVTGATLLNEVCYFCAGQGAEGGTYYGTLTPDQGGDLTMVFNFPDNNNFPGSAYVARRVTEPPNTLNDAGIFLCQGGSTYTQTDDSGSIRWGDYTAAVGDDPLINPDKVWFSATNSDTAGNWATCIGAGSARAQPVDVKVYSGFLMVGGGAPYSGLVGELRSPDIKFATNLGAQNFSYNWHPFGLTNFGADLTGFLFVLTTGTKLFSLTSDDGSQLFIDGSLVVNNGGPHVSITVTSSAPLGAGTHKFEVKFFECCGGPSGVDLTLPAGVKYGFAGTPGKEDCRGSSFFSLLTQFRDNSTAAFVLGFPSTEALRDAVDLYCAV